MARGGEGWRGVARGSEGWRGSPYLSHGYFPVASSLTTGPVAPDRYRDAHAPHKVRGPSGPGLLPLVCSAVHAHQLHRHLPPSQLRAWTPRAEKVSKVRSHLEHVAPREVT